MFDKVPHDFIKLLEKASKNGKPSSATVYVALQFPEWKVKAPRKCCGGGGVPLDASGGVGRRTRAHDACAQRATSSWRTGGGRVAARAGSRARARSRVVGGIARGRRGRDRPCARCGRPCAGPLDEHTNGGPRAAGLCADGARRARANSARRKAGERARAGRRAQRQRARRRCVVCLKVRACGLLSSGGELRRSTPAVTCAF